jgi:Acyl-CoA dehydrogenase, C-terminal domain
MYVRDEPDPIARVRRGMPVRHFCAACAPADFPFIGIAASNLPPLLLAVARRAIEEVSALAQGKVPVAASTVLRERASAQAKLAQAKAILRAGRVWLYDTLSETWEATVAGETLSLRHKADVLLAFPRSAQRGAGGGVDVQRRRHKRDLYEEPAGTLLPRRPAPEASCSRRRDPV